MTIAIANQKKNARNNNVTTTRIIIKLIDNARYCEHSCQPKTWITEILVRDWELTRRKRNMISQTYTLTLQKKAAEKPVRWTWKIECRLMQFEQQLPIHRKIHYINVNINSKACKTNVRRVASGKFINTLCICIQCLTVRRFKGLGAQKY